jgi:hypothetical protein
MYYIQTDTYVSSLEPSEDITQYTVFNPFGSVVYRTTSYDRAVSQLTMLNTRFQLRNS